jgi:hypothetical protein
VSAPARLMTAPEVRSVERLTLLQQHWERAVAVRGEWLAHGLSTAPADRDAAERILTRAYARLHRRRPRFAWVSSPREAVPLVRGLPHHGTLFGYVMAARPSGPPPLASDVAAGLARLRGALDDGLTGPLLEAPPKRGPGKKDPPPMPPLEALRAGTALREVLRRGVREALRECLADGFYLPVRATLGPTGRLPVCWYGQQDASWIAFYDALRRLGLARYGPDDDAELDDWAALARACGWWWPDEEVCVVADRPAVVRTEPVPGGWYDQVRASHVEYRDGWRPLPR